MLRDRAYVAVLSNNSRGRKKKRDYTITFHSGFYRHKVRNAVATHIELVEFSKIKCMTCFLCITELFSLVFLGFF